MILIFSRHNDYSTNRVIDWLNYYNYPFYRINATDTNRYLMTVDLNKQIIFDGIKLPIDKINAIWFRKFGIQWGKIHEKHNISSLLSNSLNSEYHDVIETIFYLLKDKKWLTNPFYGRLNKCITLLKAKECGFYIPNTYLINSSVDFKRLVIKEDLIIKSIYDMTFIEKNKYIYNMFTKCIPSNKQKYIPQIFSPSLVQKKIDKDFELRIFYINRKIFSMAIFSQLDNKTSIDSRYLNVKKETRFIPYKVSQDFSLKIIKLMEMLNLNSGSIDFIKGLDNKFYFLEVNPVGEFGMMDFFCNYKLHKIVALELINMDKNEGI
jgi:ATP-GRASP peptide maturase of grasp-with-spasm system